MNIFSMGERWEKRQKQKLASLLLLGDANCATPPACGLGMLTTNTDSPVVSQTTVGADLLEALQVFTQLTSALAHVNVGLLQGNVGEPPSNTLDCSDGEHCVPLSLQIGVHHTQDVLEVVWRNQ